MSRKPQGSKNRLLLVISIGIEVAQTETSVAVVVPNLLASSVISTDTMRSIAGIGLTSPLLLLRDHLHSLNLLTDLIRIIKIVKVHIRISKTKLLSSNNPLISNRVHI